MEHWQGEGCKTEVEATAGGLAVRRIVHNVVVDRYNTKDLKATPKRVAKWMQPVIALANGEKSDPIPLPPVPSISENLFDRVARLEAEVKQLTTELANRATSELAYANRCHLLEAQLAQYTNHAGEDLIQAEGPNGEA